MKIYIITLVCCLTLNNGFSQDLSYEIHGKYSNPVKKIKLDEAKSMSDIIPDYPASWIDRYDSLAILAIRNGKVLKAVSSNEHLSLEQKQLLFTVDMGSDISINIDFQYKNVLTDNIEVGTMNYSATLIPEIEAEFIGGDKALKQYLKENAIDKIPAIDPKEALLLIIRFTINEDGKIVNSKIAKESSYPKTDKLLLNAINKMPKWRPAENSKGIRVKQEFVFSVGNLGGC